MEKNKMMCKFYYVIPEENGICLRVENIIINNNKTGYSGLGIE